MNLTQVMISVFDEVKKHCEKRRKMLVIIIFSFFYNVFCPLKDIFSFFHNVFKSLLFSGLKNLG